jgi:uncharacterized protein (DUF433 family)
MPAERSSEAPTDTSGDGVSAGCQRPHTRPEYEGLSWRRTRITVDPDLMAGVPTIRGLRIPVATVVSMVADGMTVEEICRDLPDLTLEDVAEALRYAAESVRERQLPLRPSA